jgi:uncharacterized FlaG/YvyC family protein
MEITSTNPASAALLEATAVRPATAAENRQVVLAIEALNGAGLFGRDNELTFQIDQRTRRILVRIVNRKTGEVVSQLPPEYVLRLAEGRSTPLGATPPKDLESAASGR